MRISDWSSDVCSSDLGNDFTNRVFFACETSEAGAGHDKASGRIETLAATVVQTGDLFCNGAGHAASFRPALNCSNHSAMAGRSGRGTWAATTDRQSVG